MHLGAAAIAIQIASASWVVAVAVAAIPAHSQSAVPQEQSTVKVAEQPPARPGNAISGSCYMHGRWYPNGAKVPLDPGPASAMVAPIYVRCTQGLLCYYSAPSVCIRPGRLER
jgi:hypothetical protein